ncbi:MAG: RES family NAD+ phosphorylase [Flavobacteriaceae bacterium]|nr:RES family NAD+ phosphorylase [Flavobacteriaceae bacterium]
MELYRISAEKYATSLHASGASNRWNKKGEYVIYAGSSRSLATLELIVHRNFIKPDIRYKVMILSIPDDDFLVKSFGTKDLPLKWRKFEMYSKLQEIGSNWYNRKESLLLKVPSAIIPYESNYIINTEHPDFIDKVQLVRTEHYFWDERLF